MHAIQLAFAGATQGPSAPLPAIVFTVVENGGDAAMVIGVFEDRRRAVEVAIAHATYRLQRCCIREAAFLKAVIPDLTAYTLSIETTGYTSQITIHHKATGLKDDLTWCVREIELVRSQP